MRKLCRINCNHLPYISMDSDSCSAKQGRKKGKVGEGRRGERGERE